MVQQLTLPVSDPRPTLFYHIKNKEIMIDELLKDLAMSETKQAAPKYNLAIRGFDSPNEADGIFLDLSKDRTVATRSTFRHLSTRTRQSSRNAIAEIAIKTTKSTST